MLTLLIQNDNEDLSVLKKNYLWGLLNDVTPLWGGVADFVTTVDKS